MPTTDQVLSWRGQQLRGSDNEKLGTIEDIYLDAETREPEWALVTTGLFGTKQSFVPLREASPSSEGVTVPFDKSAVKDSPSMDPDGQLSEAEEAELYRHYGMPYGDAQSPTGLPEDRASEDDRTHDATGTVGRDVSGPTTDEAMTRSEEELEVGTTQREAGRARLQKYVVEEQVSQTIPVRREEVRIEREPITDGNVDQATDGPAISEEEHEVVLHAEEPVTEKRAVPKERVRLDKDVHTEEQEVSGTIRKERLDIDDGTGTAG